MAAQVTRHHDAVAGELVHCANVLEAGLPVIAWEDAPNLDDAHRRAAVSAVVQPEP